MSLFDAYIIVDWSARSSPCDGENSIWIAEAGPSNRSHLLVNRLTRQLAYDVLLHSLQDHVRAGHRVLLGLDFPYGYPAAFSTAVGLKRSAAPWRLVWRMLTEQISDDAANRNNRFQVAAELNARLGSSLGPFWGAPTGTPGVPQSKPIFPFVIDGQARLAEYRHAEIALRNRKRWVHSVWQLWTAGSVGGQALTGIPRVAELRDHPQLAPCSSVWPFESGFTGKPTRALGPAVIHAEIWPGVVSIDRRLHPTKDAAQVLSLSEYFRALDQRGEFGRLFDQPKTDPAALSDCLVAEGWILGA